MTTRKTTDYARNLALSKPELTRSKTSDVLRMEADETKPTEPNRFISPETMAGLGVAAAVSGTILYNKFLRTEVNREEILDELMDEKTSKKTNNPILTSSGFMSNKQIVNEEAFEREDGYKKRSNINDDEINEFQQGARFVDHVYKNTKAFGAEYNLLKMNQDRENFILQSDTFENHDVYTTGSSLSQVFVDNDKKKSFIAMRGIELALDVRDQFEILEMGITAVLPQKVLDSIYKGNRQEAKIFGNLFLRDLDHIVDVIEFTKDQFPDNEITLLGHSRAGGAVLEAGRAYDLKTFAYNPASNIREKSRDYSKHNPKNIHIFMSESDLVPMFLRNLKDSIPENTYIIKNKRTDALMNHGIHNFIENRNLHSITKTIIGDKNEEIINKTPKFSTDGIFAGYDERNNLFNDIPDSVFNNLNSIESQPFNPVSLNIFDEIDVNNDSRITLPEYDNYYKKRGVPPSAIRTTFKSLDINNDKVLTRDEFNQ